MKEFQSIDCVLCVDGIKMIGSTNSQIEKNGAWVYQWDLSENEKNTYHITDSLHGSQCSPTQINILQ